MNKRGLIFCMLILVFIGIVSADFDYIKNNLQKNYRAGETIKGTMNIKLDEENANSVLSSNFEGNISLLELLELNDDLIKGKDYDCNTPECAPTYSAGNKISSIDLNGEKIVGLKIVGDSISEIDSIEFKLESNLKNVCGLPLSADILDDGKDIISGISFNEVDCGEIQYGCFDNSLSSYLNAIIDDEICEVISVEPGPAYRIGARVINSTQVEGVLEMTLYNKEGDEFSCFLPKQTSNEQNLFCTINASSAVNTNFTVCIRDAVGLGSDYKIKYERKEPTCGIPEGRDFQIFARPLQYKDVKIEVNSSMYEKLFIDSLEDATYDYLQDNYETDDDGNVICDEGCIVPIKLKGQAQNIQIKDVNIKYRDVVLTSDNSIYEINKKEIEISSDKIEVDLEPAGFKIPINSKADEFRLYLNNNLKFKEDIEIEESFDFDIKPKFVFIGLQTKFEAVTGFNISSSKWDFGDGIAEEVVGKTATHRFTEGKTFNVEVELKRKDGIIAKKKFNIVVGNPKESANKTIENYKVRLVNLTSKIESFPIWMQDNIKQIIELDELKNSTLTLEKDFKNASSDDEYTNIMNELLKLNVPLSVSINKKGMLPLSIGFLNINADYVEEISGGKEDELEKSIVKWFNSNYNSDVEFEVISALFENEKEDILTKFKIKIEPKEGGAGYLFIDFPFESIVFEKDYGQKSIGEGSGAYLPINGNAQEIEFLVEESINVEDLGAFISPEIEKLSIDKNNKPACLPGDKKCEEPFPLRRVIFWLSIVIASFLILYIILQEWYKRNYENHLFSNKNDLYNLVNFIYNSRVSGLIDRDIRKKLKETGWTNEKISYAFKKIDGKRTGMWEIPIFKIFENRKVKKELEKRQGGQINTRFIKQSGYYGA